jgi:hypothetical protein
MLTTFPSRVTKFHSTTKKLVQYSPWVSILAVDVINYTGVSLGVSSFFFFFFLGGGGDYMDLAQVNIQMCCCCNILQPNGYVTHQQV